MASFCCVAKAWPLAWCPVWPYSSRSGVLGLCRGGAAKTEREAMRGVLCKNYGLRDRLDNHCSAIYCSLGLLAASLLSLFRLAAGRPTL